MEQVLFRVFYWYTVKALHIHDKYGRNVSLFLHQIKKNNLFLNL